MSPRNVAVDDYRGLIMLLMMAEVFELSRVSAAHPTRLFWKNLAYNQMCSDNSWTQIHLQGPNTGIAPTRLRFQLDFLPSEG